MKKREGRINVQKSNDMKTIKRILFALVAVSLLVLTGTGCTAKAKKAYHLSKADRFYDAGDYSSAEVEYLNVLRSDQANARAYGRLGLIYYDQGRLQRALFFLAKGSQMTPDQLDLRLKLGFIYSSIGMYTQAVAQANFVLDHKPQDDEAPILLVEGSIQPKDVEAARQRLQSLARNGDRAALEVALGNIAMRDRDVATAEAAYKKAQALDPKSPAVNASLAAVAWSKGDLKTADSLFKAAAEASPMRSPRRMQYVRFKVQAADLAGARVELAEILKAAPDYVPAAMAQAEIAAAEKKYDESMDYLAKVQAQDPDNFDAMFFQAQLELARGQVSQGVTDWERMVRVYPQVPPVHYQLGCAYLAAHDLTKASASFNKTLELNPNFVEATIKLAEIQIQNNNPSPAILALESVRKKQPKMIQAQLLLADAYRMQKRPDEALGIYTSLEKNFPNDTQVAVLHGATLLQTQDKAGARKEFERVLQLAPGYIPAIEQLVNLDIADKQFDAASQFINGKIQEFPKEPSLRIMAAKADLAQNKNDQAEATLLKTLEIDPDNQGAYLLLAQLYSDTGRNDKALAKLDAVMAKEPDNTSALMLAAKIYTANNDNKGAAQAYEKLLKISPDYSPALNNLAYLYSEALNNQDRAYQLAQRARELLPFDPSTADTLGWICYHRGSYQTAASLLQESAAKLTAQPDVQYHLGMAAYMLGDEVNAHAALQRALQLTTNFSGSAECARCLAIIELNPATADAAAKATLEKRVAEKADDPVALVRLARIYQRDGNTDKAIASYEALLQAMPKNLDAMGNLIRLYMPKDTKKAYEMAKAANKLAPYDASISHVLGRLAFQAGDYQLATSILQQNLGSQPNDASLLFDYAQAAYSIGKVAEAQNALQSSLNLNLAAPQATEARQTLDLIALAANPAQAAAANTRIAGILKTEPDNVPALMAGAAASENTSDAATAQKDCEQALKKYPDFIPAMKQLAQLYSAGATQLDRAYALASKAHDTLPDDPSLTKIMGIILFQRGDYSHALSPLKQSALKLTTDPEVFYYLGSAQYHLKNRIESKANLQQALNLKLTGPAADTAKQMLTELK